MPDPLKPPAEDHPEPKLRPETQEPAPPSEVAGVEIAPAKEGEKAEGPVEKKGETGARPRPTFAPQKLGGQAATPPSAVKDDLTQKIEKILEEDLYELYTKLPPEKQRAFKTKGEEVAGKIRELIAHAKVKLRKLMKLIFEWLKMLPGVNRYFLEQEAKIKADKIIKIRGG